MTDKIEYVRIPKDDMDYSYDGEIEVGNFEIILVVFGILGFGFLSCVFIYDSLAIREEHGKKYIEFIEKDSVKDGDLTFRCEAR